MTGMPTASAAAIAAWARVGCRSSVTSWMVPPVCRLAVRRTRRWCPVGSTSPSSHPSSWTVASVRSSTGMRDSPPVAASRRRLWRSMRSRTVLRPSPTISAGRRTAAATTAPSITTMRRSSPGASSSMRISAPTPPARWRATSSSSDLRTPTVMPAPCSPRTGFTTTAPASSMKRWSSSLKLAVRPIGTRTPASATTLRVMRLSSQRLMATAEVYSDSDSRVTTVRPPCSRRR